MYELMISEFIKQLFIVVYGIKKEKHIFNLFIKYIKYLIKIQCLRINRNTVHSVIIINFHF